MHLLLAQNSVTDSLQRIVAQHRRDTIEMNALLDLTFEFLRKDAEKGKSYAYQAMTLARSKQNNRKLAGAYGYMVTLHQNSGRMDSAAYYLDELGTLAKADPSATKIKIAYGQIAGLFYKNQGEYRKALPFMLDNLHLLTTENESRAGQLLNIGNTYFDLGEYKHAVNYHLQSLTLFDKLRSKRGQSFCLQSLGNDFLNLKQFEQAKKYFEQSFNLKKELQDKRGTITAFTGIADVYKELQKFETSEQYYNQALQISREMNLIKEEARCQFQLGMLYGRMGNGLKGRETIAQSLLLSRKAGDSTMTAKIRSELNGLRLMEKKERETETTFISNLNTFINSGDRAGEALEYSRLSEYHASRKQFDKALYYLKKHEQLKDSIEGSSVLLQMKQLEEQYKSEKKEKEIELLKKEQALNDAELRQQRANQTILGIALLSAMVIGLLLINRYRIMNRTKRQLELERMRQGIARDLHDDIGSTLSSINIMSQLALNESGEAGHQLKKIVSQSAHMMETMSDIVWSINPGNDSVEQMINKMKEFAGEILEPKDIDYHFDVDAGTSAMTLTAEKRKNLFLIFKEAINNAAKHSEGNKVDILLNRENGSLHLTVRDNGKGFEPSVTKSGNGLKNMEARAAALQGSLTRKSKPQTGTEIVVKVPIT